MTWWKNGLFLAAGGAIGLIAGTLLSEAIMEDDYDDDSDEAPELDGIKILTAKIRREAEAAMASCKSDAERDAVYAQIKESVQTMQERLAQKSEQIIADLQAQAARTAAPDEAPEAADPVQNIKDTMQELADALDKTLETLKPTDTSPAL